jgi:hypothetical protein
MPHAFHTPEDVEYLDDTPPHLHILRACPADNWDMIDDMADYMTRQLDAIDLAIEYSEATLRTATYHAGFVS